MSAHGSGKKLAGKGESRVSSPAAEELKLVIEVSGIAGLSCDGQEGKLVEVLGQLVAKNHGIFSGGVRVSNSVNEA